jgi:hypothetical protein
LIIGVIENGLNRDSVRTVRSMNIVDITRIIGRIGVNHRTGAGVTSTATTTRSHNEGDAQQST